MTGGIRKIALTVHIGSSVGWLGAVACFECLAIIGLASRDSLMARSAYLPMERVAWFVIVPFAVASLLSGLVMSLGTQWGLLRHYWVLAKFLINIVAIGLLILHTRLIHVLASAAADEMRFTADLRGRKIQLVVVAGVALVALVTATTLAVFKPRAMTAYGRRRLSRNQWKAPRGNPAAQAPSEPTDGKLGKTRSLAATLLLAAFGIVIILILLHIIGGGHGHQGQ
jgi:hypothetical protein